MPVIETDTRTLSEQIQRTRDILNVLRSSPDLTVDISGTDRRNADIYAVCFEYAGERKEFLTQDMIRFYQSKLDVLLAQYQEEYGRNNT